MLKLINGNTIRNEGNGSFKVNNFELLSVFFKEELHPWPCKVFHAHRVNLTSFESRMRIFRYREISAGISLESMSGFMSKYTNVIGCSVHICKNKWHFIIRKESTISSSSFSFFVIKVHQFLINHKIHKLFSLRRKFLIHLLCIRYYPFRIAFWGRVSCMKLQIKIIIIHIIYTETFFLLFLYF